MSATKKGEGGDLNRKAPHVDVKKRRSVRNLVGGKTTHPRCDFVWEQNKKLKLYLCVLKNIYAK